MRKVDVDGCGIRLEVVRVLLMTLIVLIILFVIILVIRFIYAT